MNKISIIHVKHSTNRESELTSIAINLLLIFRQIWALFVLVLSLVFILTIPVLFVFYLPLKYRLKIICPLWSLFSKICLHVGLGCHIYSEDLRNPDSSKQIPLTGLYISNHQSFVDIPLTITLFQIPPIMKKEVLYIPIFGLIGWASGALVVDRKKGTSRKKIFNQASERLKSGLALHYYPEGTRNRTSSEPKDFNDIKKALIRFAYQHNIHVVPVSLYGTKSVLSKYGLVSNRRKDLGIIVHQEVDPTQFADHDDFAHYCWSKVQEGYHALDKKISLMNKN